MHHGGPGSPRTSVQNTSQTSGRILVAKQKIVPPHVRSTATHAATCVVTFSEEVCFVPPQKRARAVASLRHQTNPERQPEKGCAGEGMVPDARVAGDYTGCLRASTPCVLKLEMRACRTKMWTALLATTSLVRVPCRAIRNMGRSVGSEPDPLRPMSRDSGLPILTKSQQEAG